MRAGQQGCEGGVGRNFGRDWILGWQKGTGTSWDMRDTESERRRTTEHQDVCLWL